MSPNRFKRHTLLGLCVAAAALAAPLAAQAQEITLKAVNAFQEGTYYARNFERFVKKVNDEGKGLIQINYIGGPKAIPTFEQGNALRSGVVDMSNTTTSFVAGIVPEGLAINYTNQTMAEMRKNGAIDYLNKIMMEKGLYYYARTGEGVQYYIYSNKRIDKADLTGLKLRIAPIYRDFFQKLGANVVQIAPVWNNWNVHSIRLLRRLAVETIDVTEKNQEISLGNFRNPSCQLVIVTKPNFVCCHRVIFIDDWNHANFQESIKRPKCITGGYFAV